MAISFVGSATAGGFTAAPTLTHGLTILEDDIVEVILNVNLNLTITDNNGANSFTEAINTPYNAGSAQYLLGHRVAGASEPATYDWTLSATDRWTIQINVYRGIDTASPFDVAPSASTDAEGSSTSPLAPSITTTTSNTLARLAVCIDDGSANTFSAVTNGFGDEVSLEADNQGSASFRKAIAAAGVVGATGCTIANSKSWVAVQYAYKEATTSNTITVDVPTHIDLEWGTTHELAVTDDTGTVTLAGVTLSAPTGWETVAFTTAPNPATTESFYEYAQTDTGLGGAGYTMLAGDILAWETQTGLTIDGQTIPQVDPPATVSGSYKIFKDATKTWTSVSTFTVNDLGFPGDPAPVLSSPTGTATGAATASGTVTTDNGTGTLYYYASTNSTETAATIKASGSSQVVGAVGSQGVGVTGLTPETLYYLHYVQDDDGAQESNVVSSSSFTTLATSDVPATSRTSIFQIANYLRSLGTYNSSQCNELVVEWLVSEGITRTQINQMLYGYLGGLGYTGSFNDRLKAWSEDV